MNIIRHAAAPAQRTTTFKLEERDPTGKRIGVLTYDNRDNALTQMRDRIKANPNLYWGQDCNRLVVVEWGAR